MTNTQTSTGVKSAALASQAGASQAGASQARASEALASTLLAVTAVVLLLCAALAPSAALAGDYNWDRGRDREASRGHYDHAEVIRVRPLFDRAARNAPQQQCTQAGAAPAQCGDVRSQTGGGLAQALSMELPVAARCDVFAQAPRTASSYEVTYRYRGRQYTRMMSYDPGRTLRIQTQHSAR